MGNMTLSRKKKLCYGAKRGKKKKEKIRKYIDMNINGSFPAVPSVELIYGA